MPRQCRPSWVGEVVTGYKPWEERAPRWRRGEAPSPPPSHRPGTSPHLRTGRATDFCPQVPLICKYCRDDKSKPHCSARNLSSVQTLRKTREPSWERGFVGAMSSLVHVHQCQQSDWHQSQRQWVAAESQDGSLWASVDEGSGVLKGTGGKPQVALGNTRCSGLHAASRGSGESVGTPGGGERCWAPAEHEQTKEVQGRWAQVCLLRFRFSRG